MRETGDEQQIRDLLTSYCYLIDHQRGSEVPDRIFTEDGLDDHGVGATRGREELRKFFDTDTLKEFLEGTAHVLGNQIVRIAGDTAHAQSYVTAWHWLQSTKQLGGARQADVVLIGIYDDTLRRTADGWRISERYVRRVGPGTLSVGDVNRPEQASLAPFVMGITSKLGVSGDKPMLI